MFKWTIVAPVSDLNKDVQQFHVFEGWGVAPSYLKWYFVWVDTGGKIWISKYGDETKKKEAGPFPDLASAKAACVLLSS